VRLFSGSLIDAASIILGRQNAVYNAIFVKRVIIRARITFLAAFVVVLRSKRRVAFLTGT
jgi:hypothetical protein